MKPRVVKGNSGYFWWVECPPRQAEYFWTWREAFDWAYAHATQHKEER